MIDTPPAFTTSRESRGMEKIAIGGQGNVWGMKKNHEVLKWTGFEWKKVPGVAMAYISVGADGAAWGVSMDSRVMRWDPWFSRFVEVVTPTPMLKISVGNSGKIWGISATNEVFKYRPNGWKKRGDLTMKHISVGADGSVWAIENQSNAVYRWLSKTNEWSKVSAPLVAGGAEEKMKHISVGGQNVVWGVSTQNVLYHWIEPEQRWQNVTDQDVPLKGVSVAADGTVVGFGIDLEKKLKLKGKILL
jgi:hypothetical protein